MLQVSTNCYYLEVKGKEWKYWGLAWWLFSHQNSEKQQSKWFLYLWFNKNSAAMPNMQNIYLHTFHQIPCFCLLFCLWGFSYFDDSVHNSNRVLLMYVQQRTHYLSVLLRKYKHPDLYYPSWLVTTPVLH